MDWEFKRQAYHTTKWFADLLEPGDSIMADKGFSIRDLATKKRVLFNVLSLCKGMWGNVTEICRLFSVNKKWGGGLTFEFVVT